MTYDLDQHLSKFKESETNIFKYESFNGHKLLKGNTFVEFVPT